MASIYGSARYGDGSKIDGTATVSTSWNSKKAYPKHGEYHLDLGGNPKQRIKVYVNGDHYADVYIDGDERLDIRL